MSGRYSNDASETRAPFHCHRMLCCMAPRPSGFKVKLSHVTLVTGILKQRGGKQAGSTVSSSHLPSQ